MCQDRFYDMGVSHHFVGGHVMSLGSPIVKTRMPAVVIEMVMADIERRKDADTVPDDYSLSDWLRDAVTDRLDHHERSVKAMKKRRATRNMARSACRATAGFACRAGDCPLCDSERGGEE